MKQRALFLLVVLTLALLCGTALAANTAPTAQDYIKYFNMQELDKEGGYFVELFGSQDVLKKDVLPARFSGDRQMYGFIYYMITQDTFSNWHKLKCDEFWQWAAGDVAEQLQIYPDGTLKRIIIGPGFMNGEKFVSLIPNGVWQSTRIYKPGKFVFFGITTSPRFDYSDWDNATQQQMISNFPQHKQAILDFAK